MKTSTRYLARKSELFREATQNNPDTTRFVEVEFLELAISLLIMYEL